MLELDGIREVIFPIIQFADEGSEPRYFNSASLDTQCLILGQHVGVLTLRGKHSPLITQLVIGMSVTTGSWVYKD